MRTTYLLWETANQHIQNTWAVISWKHDLFFDSPYAVAVWSKRRAIKMNAWTQQTRRCVLHRTYLRTEHTVYHHIRISLFFLIITFTLLIIRKWFYKLNMTFSNIILLVCTAQMNCQKNYMKRFATLERLTIVNSWTFCIRLIDWRCFYVFIRKHKCAWFRCFSLNTL